MNSKTFIFGQNICLTIDKRNSSLNYILKNVGLLK